MAVKGLWGVLEESVWLRSLERAGSCEQRVWLQHWGETRRKGLERLECELWRAGEAAARVWRLQQELSWSREG